MPPFSAAGSGGTQSRLRVCCLLLYHRTLAGNIILQEKSLFVNLSPQ